MFKENCKLVNIKASRLKARFMFYRLLMTRKFDVYVLRPFKVKFISKLVTCINGLNFTVIQKNVAKHAETEEPKKLYRELNSFENETLVTLA